MNQVEIYCGISELYAENWLRIDRRSRADVAELFMPDGVLVYDTYTWKGRAAISDFYRGYHASNERRQRTTRHHSAAPSIRALDDGRYLVESTVFVFSGLGPQPIDLRSPSAVGDLHDLCMRDDEHGNWRFVRRETRITFKNESAFDFAANGASSGAGSTADRKY